MVAVLVDSSLDAEAWLSRVYAGDLLQHRPTPSTLEFCAFADGMLRDAFPGRDPQTAQHVLDVTDFAKVLAEVKPAFIHHPESKRLISEILLERGCDPDDTYFDVPRLRSSTSDDYLTSGIAYAFHPHRDTWYSAAMAQVNWWMPVYPITPDNGMAFHPEWFDRSLPNSSAQYDYQRWNETSRFNAAEHIGTDTREQPRAQIDIDITSDLRIVPPVGGLIVFSAAQLHSSLPNRSGRTRYSIDFRTVCRSHLEQHMGASNADSRCSGTALTDFVRVSDLEPLPADLVEAYMPGHPSPAR